MNRRGLRRLRFTIPMARLCTVEVCMCDPIPDQSWMDASMPQDWFTGGKRGSSPITHRKLGKAVSGGNCFVATACYGDSNHPSVVTIRAYRDNVLCRSALGRRFIEWYNETGPRIAVLIDHHPLLRFFARAVVGVFALLLRLISDRRRN